MSLLNEKKKALALLLGDEADHILRQAETTQKQAEAAGIAFKEARIATDRSPSINELMELWESVKEAEAEIAADEADLWDDLPNMDYYEPEEETAVKADDMTEFKAYMYKMGEKLDKLMSMLGPKQEEEKKKEADTDTRIAQLEAEIATLKGEQPAALSGYRATLHSDPIIEDIPDFDTQRQKAIGEMGPASQMFDAAANLTAGLFNQ